MVATDKRRTLIVSTAGIFFGLGGEESRGSPKDNQAIIDKFLDVSDCRIISAYPIGRGPEEMRLKFSNEVPMASNALVFLKLRGSVVTEENFHDLIQVTTTGGPRYGNAALIESLRHVWRPLLVGSFGANANKLKRLEEEILGPGTSSTVREEEKLWERKREEADKKAERKIAGEALETVKNIRAELENGASARDGLAGLEEIVETVAGYVDDLWKLDGAAYDEERMKRLFDIVGDEVVRLVQSLLDEVRGTDRRARDEAVATGARVTHKWVDSCEKFTRLFWPHQSLHPWKGGLYVPERCAKFAERLRETAEIRAQHRQLTRLLTPGERSTLGTDALLCSLDDLRVGLESVNEDGDVEWQRLKRRFEESLAPAEEKVSEKLRKQMAGARNSVQLAAEFERYVDLLKRERVRGALRSERESLLASMRDLIDSCQTDPDTVQLLDGPRVLQEVHWARATEMRLAALERLSKELLSDLAGYEAMRDKIASGAKNAEKKRQELVDTWIYEVKSGIERKELSLGSESAVVELTGPMRVNYEPRLARIVREARGLSAEGIELPREIEDLVERAGELGGRARALERIANFHNTIGDRMVPSQRPLMLATALELARAVREQSGVVWSDPRAIDAYTARLGQLVEKLARLNSVLAAKHATLRDALAALLSGEIVNLVGSHGAWKETLKNVRTVVEAVDNEYGNAKTWKLHWNRQLAKVLGVAYRAALPGLTRKLSEIKVELSFRDGNLEWRPPLEEIRAKVYSAIGRFLAIPSNFRGIGGDEITDGGEFSGLVDRSAYLFGAVYKEAEIALSAVEAVRDKWISLSAPAKIDVGERLKGRSPQEWERAFKDAKQWAQELGKLRGGRVKMWCIIIDTGTTRNDLESASRSYWDRLSSDLRAEASSRLVAIVDFLSTASRELERRPTSVEQIGAARELHERIEAESSRMAQELEAMVGLSRILAAWTREKLDGVSGVHAGWQALSERLERHRSVVDRQLEDARVNVAHRAAALQDEKERWQAKWSEEREMSTRSLEWIGTMRQRWQSIRERQEELKNDCRRLGVEMGEIALSELETDVESRLEAEESNCRFEAEFTAELENQMSEEWSIARRRLPRVYDWLESWEKRIRLRKERSNEENTEEKENSSPRKDLSLETSVGKKIAETRANMERLEILRGDELAEEHWAELRELLDLKDVKGDPSLGDLMKKGELIGERADRVKEIRKRAVAESGIRQALAEIESWEATARLETIETQDSTGATIRLVGEYGQLLARAGQLRLILEGAKGSSGYERFAERAARCETAMFELEERVKLLSAVQRKWVYLEPVYGAGSASPSDAERWSKADKELRRVMGQVARDPTVPSLRKLPLAALVNFKDLLDRCQQSLDEYLEEKRLGYPRLFFLSDEHLLELVSGSGGGLEAHLPKLFQGIGGVVREGDLLEVVVSPEGEKLQLTRAVDIGKPLPEWLASLEEVMRETLSRSLEKCLRDSNPDPSAYPAQVLLLTERIRFTERCETALERESTSSLKNLIEYLEGRRAKYRSLEEESSERLNELKARSLLLETVHHLRVSRNLLTAVERAESTSWIWRRQVRSYSGQGGPVVRCAGAEFPYRYEYQGAAVGLVRTTLTEKSFLAMCQAMKLGLGASPTGPAGTGKTESVKALAGILGRPVLVFNCDRGMDSASVRRILGGLAGAGAWGCFDEFNRLEEETLSALSMLIGPLQEAIRSAATSVKLGDNIVKLDAHCCIFVTMNPPDGDYGARQKLPDSLARLFRPVGMAHPDRCDIVRALLECRGFQEAPSLAARLVEILDISERLLCKQAHYDWGLRALRSVVDALPLPELESKNVDSDGGQEKKLPRNLSESERLLVAIRSSILPKLVEQDAREFDDLIAEVFPKVECSLSLLDLTGKRDLRKVLEDACTDLSLSGQVVDRCVQLYEQLQSRTGVAVVGPPGCGKSLVRKILAKAMEKIEEPVKQFEFYPGAIAKSKLVGQVDPRTREWKEGLLPNAVSMAGNSLTWIVFNGDVEPEWAEALNSALDDNRILTLPSGVGVRLGHGTRFIFETDKLSGASPATVSRLGVVHLGVPTAADFLGAAKIEDLSSVATTIARNHLTNLIETILKTKENGKSASGLLKACLVHLTKVNTPNSGTHALLGSLCAQLTDGEPRNEIARSIYEMTDSWCPDPQTPLAVLYDPKMDRLEALVEEDNLRSIVTDEGPVLLSGAISGALAILLPWLESGHPTMIRGPEGCGKSCVVSAALASRNDQMDDRWTVVRGSSLYGPQDLITRLKRWCIRLETSVNGRNYVPKNGSRLILVLEDLSSASKDLQELMRQLIEEGGFYEDDLEFASLPMSFLCTGNESTRLHPRLESLLATHHLPYPTGEEMVSIARLHLTSALRGKRLPDDWSVTRLARLMAESIGTIGDSKNNTKFVGSPRDLAQWADRLTYYPLEEGDASLAGCLWDAGIGVFYPRWSAKERELWASSLLSKIGDFRDKGTLVYAWNGGVDGLDAKSDREWRSRVEDATSRCAREGQTIRTPISMHVLKTIEGISRAFGSGNRGVLLTGRPGAGRRTATKLVASISGLRLIDAAPGRGKLAVKSAVQAAGIEGEPCLLMLEEHHAREQGLAVLLGALVSRGELPGLVGSEELDALVAPLAELARTEDFAGSLDQYLCHRLKRLLRVVVIVDNGDEEKEWLSRSGLVRRCVLVAEGPGTEWWSKESSLQELCTIFATEEEKSADINGGASRLVSSHLRAPPEQRSPAQFFALLSTWRRLKDEWSEEIGKKLSSLEAGIGRLREAGGHVAKLEEEATKQRQELDKEKARAKAALEEITATMRGATGQRGEMTRLKAETEGESAELARRKVDIERELGKVEPLVEEAAQAVAGIGADALAEVRSLRAPPAPVRDVLEGVLRLMGIRDTSWNSMKTFLAKRGVKEEIRSWDARRSTPASLVAVAKLVEERPESFEEKTAKRASVAAAPLAAWVLANLRYGQIVEQVAPLEREQRVLAERLSAAELQLGELAAGLSSVEGRVSQLQEQLAEHSRGAAALELRIESTESGLETARALLSKLDAEHGDWQSQYETLTERKSRLDVEAAEVASLLVYQDMPWSPGSEDEDRKRSAIEMLTTERERLLWRAQGLPVDTVSFLGAARCLRGPLVPLLVDPSGVAVDWLKAHLAKGLEVVGPEETGFSTRLETAVRFGKSILVEDLVGELPAALLPLIRGRSLRLADRTLPAQPGFKLYLATRSELLIDSLPSEASAVLVRISVGAGTSSLAERFVEKALLADSPELEAQRREALEKEEKLSGERDAARLDLLRQLGSARGQDLLEESRTGGGLLSSLEATQAKAREIAAALEKSRRSRESAAKKGKTREKLARFAAHLYKAVRRLANLSPMYVFSVEEFTDVYLEAEAARDAANGADNADATLEKKLIGLIVRDCAATMYRRDRLAAALHLALSLHPVPDAERKMLLESSRLSTREGAERRELPDWIPDERKSAVSVLAGKLPQVAAKLKPAWLQDVKEIWADETLSPFEKTLVVQTIRPDHLHTALTKLAIEYLGVDDLKPAAWSLKTVAEETVLRPVLLLLSPGADPAPELRALASDRTASCQGFVEISLGEGQARRAEAALENTWRSGGWILLSNLHLALNWLPRLERALRSEAYERERKASTRIWLTSEECPGFYAGLAGMCRKLAYEPPEGVKRNVQRSLHRLEQLGPKTAVGVADGGYLVLAWLHAILQERRRFVPRGWIRAYEWSEADIEAARDLVLVSDRSSDSEEEARGLLDAAVYGGRIQDEFDARALRAIIRVTWSKEVFKARQKLGGAIQLTEGTKTDPARVVRRLPEQDSPLEYFGLPANAHRAWESSAAESALEALRGVLTLKSDKSGNGRRKDRVKEVEVRLKRILEAAAIAVSPSNRRGESDKGKSKNNANPVETFLANERRRLDRLLELARNDLDAGRIEGTGSPKKWLDEWPSGPRDVVTFLNRLTGMRDACLGFLEAPCPPENIRLARLMRPRAFLAALKRHMARKTGEPLESLELRADWSPRPFTSGEFVPVGGSPPIFLRLDGLVISGARIDESGALKEVDAMAPPLVAIRNCAISFLPNVEPNDSRKARLDIPVYADFARKHRICALPVVCPPDQRDNWLQRAVALHL